MPPLTLAAAATGTSSITLNSLNLIPSPVHLNFNCRIPFSSSRVAFQFHDSNPQIPSSLFTSVIMAAESIQNEKVLASASPNPPVASCRKTKRDDTMFLEDLKDHIDEFIHASMDEHKSCFQKTINKMFGMSKVVAERHAADATGVEVSLPLQTTVSD